jgi:hypothetical protein
VALKSITELEHLSYYSDLAPSDFWLFPKKVCLKETKIQDTENIQKNVTTLLKAIPQQAFQKYLQHWQHRWAKCMAV